MHDLSVCEPTGLAAALDYDIIISCVDRPWARGVLNTLAFADLVPVLDGGIGIDTFDDGQMRNAVWRSHLLVPGEPCLVCNRQLDAADIQTDKLGLFDDPQYIRGASTDMHRERQNVAILAASVSASLLTQFVSLTVAPGRDRQSGPAAVRTVHPHARAPGHSGQAAVPFRDPDSSRRQPYPADWPAWRRPRNPGRTAYPSGTTHHPPPPEARRARRLARQPISHHHETRSAVAA